MTMTADQIEAFLDEYEQALSDFDADKSASLWGVPGMLLSDDFVGALDSRSAMAEGLASGYPFYRELGLERVEHTLLGHEDLSERVTRVRVLWHFYSGDELLVDGNYEYLIRADDDGPHMYVGVSIDEMDNLRRLAAERGIQVPG